MNCQQMDMIDLHIMTIYYILSSRSIFKPSPASHDFIFGQMFEMN